MRGPARRLTRSALHLVSRKTSLRTGTLGAHAMVRTMDTARNTLPTLWLLGKTGAGKSTIVQRLTGNPEAVVGSGYAPCTQSAQQYCYPEDQPVMRFIDTRGLGETHYDATADLAACEDASHALLLVARLDEPDQQVLIDALRAMGRKLARTPILVVHTGLEKVTDPAMRDRARVRVQQQLESALQRSLPQVGIDFPDAAADHLLEEQGLSALQSAIVELVPELVVVLDKQRAQSAEEQAFEAHRGRILGYASAAAALDLAPAVGLVAVPSLQGKMMHDLAQRYQVAWDARRAAEFLGALGSSFLYRYALGFAGRQLGKLIPVVGQTAGSAAAASVSFASTFALGRATCLYLYHSAQATHIDTEELQDAFRRAFREQQHSRSRMASTGTQDSSP